MEELEDAVPGERRLRDRAADRGSVSAEDAGPRIVGIETLPGPNGVSSDERIAARVGVDHGQIRPVECRQRLPSGHHVALEEPTRGVGFVAGDVRLAPDETAPLVAGVRGAPPGCAEIGIPDADRQRRPGEHLVEVVAGPEPLERVYTPEYTEKFPVHRRR